MKKIFTLFLAVAASVGTMFAEGRMIGDLYYYLYTNQTAEVTYRSYSNNIYNEDWNVTTANIPSSVTYNSVTYSVTSIGDHAFRECSWLKSVTIPNSVTNIGNYAFDNCTRLTSVTIPNSVTSIGYDAFYYCTSLTSVTIGNSVTSIGNYAFSYCKSLTSVTIPNSVTSIGERVFMGCKSLISITIPNSVTSIGEWAFEGCSSLTSVTIPNSVTSIGEIAFRYCTSLTSVTIPNSVTSIGAFAFGGCSSLTAIDVATDNPNYCSEGGVLFSKYKTTLIQYPIGNTRSEYIIPNSVTSIGDYAFYECSKLTSITIPNSVTSIGKRAFSYCSSLTSITIPNSVTSIGDYAFSDCSGLTSVTIEAETPPVLDGKVFYQTNNCPIYVPCNAVNTYKTAEEWSRYADRIRGNGNCTSSYTIKFKNWDGSVLQSKQVEEGQMPQYTGTTPTKPDDSQYTYTFSGWTPKIVAATADATYTATFTDTPRNQGVEDVLSDEVQSTKVVKDGQVLILRNGKTYTMQGQEVK